MIDARVLPGFQGVAVHDGQAPYRNFIEALHALFGAHHLRELTCAEEQGQAWAPSDSWRSAPTCPLPASKASGR
jgi:Transposase IS66 family